MIGRLVPEFLKRRMRKWVIDEFHQLWYNSPHTWRDNSYLGHPIWQLPLDLMLYQQMIYKNRPAFIVQTGVAFGGSVLYFATLLDLIQAPASAIVVGLDIDITPKARTLTHPRIRLIEADSGSPKTLERVRELLPSPCGMVVLDSDHSCVHVLKELELYHTLVGPGGNLVVEDTNINNHPVFPESGPGPMEAVDKFIVAHPDFRRDDTIWRRNLFSFHQGGWLVRDGAAAAPAARPTA